MKILALEPYFGGSHQAFLTGWMRNSQHEWTLLKAPAHSWKWRMRHSAVTFAEQTCEMLDAGQNWDVIFCSDMLNLAEFLGLAPPEIRKLPAVAYFHENQLTYPTQIDDPRDVHFGLTNMTTAIAADAVWFNSKFHKDSFILALRELLRKFPPPDLLPAVDALENKIEIQPPGIDEFPLRKKRSPGPMKILFAARWEHDKNPESFFKALEILQESDVEFRLSVIGQQFRDVPEIFASAKKQFASNIDRWGYLPSRAEYVLALTQSDVAVSTANHEFFGLSMVEAALAGALPLVPNRLAYPEIFGSDEDSCKSAMGENPFIYDGTAQDLAERLKTLAEKISTGSELQAEQKHARAIAEKFTWPHRAKILDEALEKLA